MIIGCTGNYRKEEFYSILKKIHTILSKENVEFIISSDLKSNSKFNIPPDYRVMDFQTMIENVIFYLLLEEMGLSSQQFVD